MMSVCGKVEPFAPESQWKRLQRQRDFDVFRHVEERAGPDVCAVQRRKFFRSEDRLLRHEMLAKQVGVFGHGGLQRLPDHALGSEVFGVQAAVEQSIVGEDHLAGDFFVANRTANQPFVRGGIDPLRRRVMIQGNFANGGETPGLLCAGRHRLRLEIPPSLNTRLLEPVGQTVRGPWVRRGQQAAVRAGDFRLVGDARGCRCLRRVGIVRREKCIGLIAHEFPCCQPTEPSISRSINRLSSTLYSIGNCRTRSLTKPLTVRLIA